MKFKVLLLSLLMSLLGVQEVDAQEKGYEKSIEAGVAVGVGKYKNTTFSASMINGYRFSPSFYLGLGVGIGYTNALSYVEDNDYKVLGVGINITKERRFEVIPVPIFASAKYTFSNGNITPFLRLNVGYTIDLNQYLKDAPGLMIEPALGMDFRLGERTAVYALLGFNMQNFKFNYEKNLSALSTDSNFYVDKKSEMLNAVSLRVGIKF